MNMRAYSSTCGGRPSSEWELKTDNRRVQAPAVDPNGVPMIDMDGEAGEMDDTLNVWYEDRRMLVETGELKRLELPAFIPIQRIIGRFVMAPCSLQLHPLAPSSFVGASEAKLATGNQLVHSDLISRTSASPSSSSSLIPNAKPTRMSKAKGAVQPKAREPLKLFKTCPLPLQVPF